MFTDSRLGIDGCLAKTRNAERLFCRNKGDNQMPQFVAALHRHAHPETTANTPGAAA